MTLPDFTPAQQRALAFLQGEWGCNLFARPGTGKTRVALEWIRRRRGRTLVVAPLFPATTVWPAENRKWGYNLDMRVLHGKGKKIGNEAVTVINYEGLPWLKLHGLKSYTNVVYDEIHYFKNPGSKRFRTWREPARHFHRRLGLTGTPVGNNLRDLWGEMFMIDYGESLGTVLHGPHGYLRRYFDPHPYIRGVWLPKEDSAPQIFNAIRRRVVTMDYVKGDLPELRHNVIPIELPAKARAWYTTMQKTYCEQELSVSAANAGVLSQKLRQIAAGAVYDDDGAVRPVHTAKQRALQALLQELQGAPLLVFTQFAHDIDAIRALLGAGVPVVDGHTSTAMMVKRVEQWNRRELPVLVAHPAKLGVGGNMQAGGSNVCFYTLPWSLGDAEQAIGRVWRQGQTAGVCIVHYLSCVATKDEAVAAAIHAKQRDQDALFTQLDDPPLNVQAAG